MIKKPLKIIFGDYEKIAEKLKIDPNKRPQNLDPIVYFNLCSEYEKSNL